MSSERKYHFWFLFFQRVLALFGVVGVLGPATQANASIERERIVLEARVTAARDIIRNLEKEAKLIHIDEPPRNKVAQWYPWGNWRNWFNGR